MPIDPDISPSDFEAHEARVCIQKGYTLDDKRRSRDYSENQYFRSIEEMNELFLDLPEALSNTARIAEKCNLDLELGKFYLPLLMMPIIIVIGRLIFADSNTERLIQKLSFNFDGFDGAFSILTVSIHSHISLIFGLCLIFEIQF